MIDIKKRIDVNRISEEWYKIIMDFFTKPCRPFIIVINKNNNNKERIYFDSYAEKLKYQCLEVVFLHYNKDKRHRKRCVSQLLYWWRNLKKIILATPDQMNKQISIWEKRKIGSKILLQRLSQVLIPYYEIIAKKKGHFLVDQLQLKTCPYCNRQFIHSFKGRTLERPELDHFYPKQEFPLFCLSFYNLIPACHSCNHIKMEERLGVNPYQKGFRSHFVITDNRGVKLTKSKIYKLTKKEIRLSFDRNDVEEEMNVSVLGLEDVYNKHTDYVKELIDKSMAYDEHAKKALINSFQGAGYHPRQVHDFIWGRHLMEAEYEDRPLSKLTKDILTLLDIHRK